MLSGRPFVVGVADFGVTHFIRDFHALVDDLFDTAQCRGVIAAVVFRESLFEGIPALEGSLPTVIEGRGILLQQLGYLERIVAPTGCVFRSIVQIRSFIEFVASIASVFIIVTRSGCETCKGHSHQE